MQPAPDQNQAPADPSTLPTEPLVPQTVPLISQQQGIAGGKGLMPVQSTLPPEGNEPPPLPMKQRLTGSASESLETVESQETNEVETFYSSEVDAPTSPSLRQRRICKTIRFIFIVIEIVLTLRFFLKLAGANPASPFGVFLFGLTDPLASPFASLFPNPMSGRDEIEFTTLLALIVYPIFGWMIIRGVQLMFYREQGGQRVVHQKRHTNHEGF